jgi:hypothetical protein
MQAKLKAVTSYLLAVGRRKNFKTTCLSSQDINDASDHQRRQHCFATCRALLSAM